MKWKRETSVKSLIVKELFKTNKLRLMKLYPKWWLIIQIQIALLGSITRDIVNTFPKLLESLRYNIRKMGKQTEFSRVSEFLSFGCKIIFTNSPII